MDKKILDAVKDLNNLMENSNTSEELLTHFL